MLKFKYEDLTSIEKLERIVERNSELLLKMRYIEMKYKEIKSQNAIEKFENTHELLEDALGINEENITKIIEKIKSDSELIEELENKQKQQLEG